MLNDNQFYEGKIRTRVCGLIIKDDKLLTVKHNLKGKPFYAPPGGNIEFGESMQDALIREVYEETFVKVKSCKFQFITQYIAPPLHAIEVFFQIIEWDGIAQAGRDPESELNIIEEVNWFSISELKQLKKEELHHAFHNCNNLRDIFELSGYIPYPTN